jgi:hypothetical protein
MLSVINQEIQMTAVEIAKQKLEAVQAQRRWAASRRDRALELALAVEGYECWRELERLKRHNGQP